MEKKPLLTKDKTASVLFIGNSYTFFNQLWDVFQAVAEAAGYSVTVDSVTSGGYCLSQHADPQDPCGRALEEKLRENHYDVAFLQEQSRMPLMHEDQFAEGAKAIIGKLAARGVRPVFYETWGRKNGAVDMIGDNETMTYGLAKAYEKLGAKLQVPVSPAGMAFFEIYSRHPQIELYHPDGSHPTMAGTYLAALCHFVTLTGENPLELPYDGNLDPHEAYLLKQAAYDTAYVRYQTGADA